MWSLSTTLFSDEERPRLPASPGCGNGDLRPKKPLADHCLSTLGDNERAVRLWLYAAGEVFNRGNNGSGGGWRGAMYFSDGFIVLRLLRVIDVVEALLKRKGVISVGT